MKSGLHKAAIRLRSKSSAAAMVAMCGAISFPITAIAQITAMAPPKYSMTDENGVNLLTLLSSFAADDVSIGPATGGLTHTVTSPSSSFEFTGVWSDNMTAGLNAQAGLACRQTNLGTAYSVSFEGASECFYLSSGAFTAESGRGSKLVANGDGTYTYTLRDGSIITIDGAVTLGGIVGALGAVTKIVRPTGLTTKILYESITSNSFPQYRIRRITTNFGFGLEYRYISDSNSDMNAWHTATEIVSYNATHQHCAFTTAACSLTSDWPRARYVYGTISNGTTFSVIDAAGRTTRYTMDRSLDPYARVTGVKFPSSSSADNISYTYCPTGLYCTNYKSLTNENGRLSLESITVRDIVRFVTREGATWNYGVTFSIGGGALEERTGESPTGAVSTSLKGGYGIVYFYNRNGQRFNFSQDLANRLTSIVEPEGNSISYSYDTRGNITASVSTPKVNSGLSSTSMTANFDAICGNIYTCNQPNWSEDQRGNRTNYIYSAQHGGIVKVSGPYVNGVKFEKRVFYVQKQANLLNASGQYLPTGEPVWLIDYESTCKTGNPSGNGCALAGDEIITAYEYGPNNGPNNLQVRGFTVSGGGLTARTCFSYDKFGNKISEISANANLAAC